MTQQDRSGGAGEPVRGELVPARAAESMREWAEQLVARAREDGVALTGEGGLLTDLMRNVLQTGLELEMAEHLGYERGAAPPGGTGNARNGGYNKTVTTEIGEVELRVPRDRRVRGSQVANRPVYVAIGVNLEGERDVLGLWLGPIGW